MAKKKKAGKPARAAHGCEFVINVRSRGDVNFYNCTDSEREEQPCPPPEGECPPPPTATGACVPLGLGSKPKQSQASKLGNLLSGNPVPSALAASFIQLSRRFLQNKAAGNPLEVEAFKILRSLSPELKGVLSCALDSFDSLSGGDRNRLFDPALTADIDRPIDPDGLAVAVGQEIAQRASQQVFGDPTAAEQERPGLNRFFDPGGEFFEAQLRICKVNGLRTNVFKPLLDQGEYPPAELQQKCETVLVGNEVQLNCQNQVGDCPGNFLTGEVCLRVPDIEAGQGVVLEGVNYMSLDISVRLVSKSGNITRELDAHVFGDLDTPLNEEIDGNISKISDCRVHDRLAFTVPADLPPEIYSVQLALPNTTGIPILGDPILSDTQFINVIAPATARFQITLETLRADEETSPASFGSDEVGLSVVAAALLPDGTTSELQVLKNSDGKNALRFGDVDSGDSFQPNRVLFSHQQNILGMAMAINGYEIDSESAFEDEINSFSDAFVEIIKKEWDFIKAGLAAAGGYQALSGLGLTGFIVIGIAAAVLLGIDAVIALWAPADPIMHDALGFTTNDLALLTSFDVPLPDPSEFDASDDIHVSVLPLSKLPQQFHERRDYESDDEDSLYQLTLRYDRLA